MGGGLLQSTVFAVLVLERLELSCECFEGYRWSSGAQLRCEPLIECPNTVRRGYRNSLGAIKWRFERTFRQVAMAQRDDDRLLTAKRCRTKFDIYPGLEDRPIATEHGENVGVIDSIFQAIQPIGTGKQIPP